MNICTFQNNIYSKMCQGDMLRLCTSAQHVLKSISYFMRYKSILYTGCAVTYRSKNVGKDLQTPDVIVVLLNYKKY